MPIERVGVECVVELAVRRGLSHAVVVIEAAERSGSLLTAGHALDQGREVLAVPGPATAELSRGCNRLIREGAVLVRSAEDIILELPPTAAAALPEMEKHPADQRQKNIVNMNHDEKAVVSLLNQTEPVHIDELAERLKIGIGRLQTALFSLEVRGAVEQSPGRYYLLRPREES